MELGKELGKRKNKGRNWGRINEDKEVKNMHDKTGCRGIMQNITGGQLQLLSLVSFPAAIILSEHYPFYSRSLSHNIYQSYHLPPQP